ncbi:MAG TPA: hypothetical protein VER55_00425, partial [Ardenticatenaceae bacterium]|nr:hypothetical protein [Ardenticatenaceae bacterium]
MASGYSGRPLRDKLGIKVGFSIAVIDPPDRYWELVGPLPPAVVVEPAGAGLLNYIHLFVTERAALEAQLPGLRAQIVPDGMIWVSWPKRAAKVATDVTEDVVREVALKNGLVDTKVCAID